MKSFQSPKYKSNTYLLTYMHSVKKVKKVLTRTLPRYYLRSRKRYALLFKPVVFVADQETQADLSDEDREALFAELPFHFLSSPESDTEVEEHLNTSPSYTCPIPSSSEVPNSSRLSTAFCSPTQGEVTNFDPRDISVDSDDESFVHPSDSEEELRDSHTPRTCPERSYQFSPFYIEHLKGESNDSDIADKPHQSSNCRNNVIISLRNCLNSYKNKQPPSRPNKRKRVQLQRLPRYQSPRVRTALLFSTVMTLKMYPVG